MWGRKPLKEAGYIQITGLDGNVTERHTLQCVHCGMHWVPEPGSGRVRGFCLRCHGVTCGKPVCDVCLPYEARIELMEGTKPGQPARRYLEEFLRVEGPDGS